MSRFRTFPGEQIIYQDGGVATFELSATPVLGEGILTNRRFIHQLSPVFTPHTFFLVPNGVTLAIPLEEVISFTRQGNLYLVTLRQRSDVRIQVRDGREWLPAWLKAFKILTGTDPQEVSPGTFLVRQGDPNK